MDFLGQVSLRFVDEVAESDEDNDAGGMFGFVRLPSLFSAIDNFTAVSTPIDHDLNIFPRVRGQPYVDAFEAQLHCPRE